MIGGQAVIEGVMMRGPKNAAMSVRTPDGSITTETWPVVSVTGKHSALRIPFVRGMINFVEMLVFGYKCLMRSAELSGLGDDEDEKKDEITPAGETAEAAAEKAGPSDKEKEKALTKLLAVLSSLLGAAAAVVIFLFIPAALTKLLQRPLAASGFAWAMTLIEGLVRIVIFIAYLAVVSRMKDIRRVYEYHGAEHKSIYCYEHGEELTPENARKYTRLHPRCGTSFLLIVLIVSILVFSLPFVPWSSIPLRMLFHLILLPVVVGISYEIIRFAGRHDNSFMRFILAPGLGLQLLTTREPDDSQLEVALASLKAVLTGNREDDKW